MARLVFRSHLNSLLETSRGKPLVIGARNLLGYLNLRNFSFKQAAVFAMTVFHLHSAQAQISCELVFSRTSQKSSAVISDRVAKNDFITNRSLFDYIHDLHPDFKTVLSRLSSDSHWIDMGAGKAKAQIEFLKSIRNPLNRPYVTAVAYKIDRWWGLPTFNGKLEVHEGPFEFQPTEQWRSADLITDVMGIFSYTTDLTTTLQKTFDLLKIQGELYISTSSYGSKFKVQGQILTLEAFLATISGLKVEGKWGAIKVIKEQKDILIPQMELQRFTDDSPPLRLFLVH
jgi:hypothetical protein